MRINSSRIATTAILIFINFLHFNCGGGTTNNDATTHHKFNHAKQAVIVRDWIDEVKIFQSKNAAPIIPSVLTTTTTTTNDMDDNQDEIVTFSQGDYYTFDFELE